MTEITGSTRLLGVIGWPVAHTMSPPMQNDALRRLGLDWVYVPMPVRPEELREAVAGARALGFVGLNVTVPHKEAMARLMDHLDPTAAAIGAVNTVHFTEEGCIGHNSDAYGFSRTVQVEGAFDFSGRTVLQIGAGGVGRAMAAGAAEAGAGRVLLFNRSHERAVGLAGELAQYYPGVRFEALTREEMREAAAEADLIANATTLGMKPDDAVPIEEAWIEPRHVVFDTVYTPAVTRLLAAAQRRGARTVGGLGMLARQGAMSLRIWTRGLVDREPDEDRMLEVLRERMRLRDQQAG